MSADGGVTSRKYDADTTLKGYNLGPVPKTVPTCSHVLGSKHVLIVLDYSVERCKTGRQIK